MIVIAGLVILITAMAGVLSNSGSSHVLGHARSWATT